MKRFLPLKKNNQNAPKDRELLRSAVKIAHVMDRSLLNFILIVLSMPLSQTAIAQSRSNLEMPLPSSIIRIAPPPPISLQPLEAAPTQGASGIDVRVNTNSSTLTRPQVEPSVASNPNNPLQLVAGFADFLNDSIAFDTAPGISLSTDGGKTWATPFKGPICLIPLALYGMLGYENNPYDKVNGMIANALR